MKKIGLAKKNAFILVMTLLPFIFGIFFSLYKSNEMEEFGIAINIAGSQRMRTMLIANVVQNIEDYREEDNIIAYNSSLLLLDDEIANYELFMDAIINGNEELGLSPNKYPEVIDKIEDFQVLYNNYILSAASYIKDTSQGYHVDYIVNNALILKDQIHLVVEEYQDQYDNQIMIQQKLNGVIIFVATLLTLFGLNLTKRLQENEIDATYDFLTGLKTRKVMFKEAKKGDVSQMTICFIDLDKFKEVNDTFGHKIGDEILIEATKRFVNTFGYEYVYRYAGDEFIILMDFLNSVNEASYIDQMILELKNDFRKPIIDSNGVSHYLGFSCGIVTKEAGVDEIYDLVNLADDLMYDSKNFASQVIICDSKIKANNRLNLKSKAKDALALGQIIPYLQPIYNIYKDELVGFELLARWELDGVVYTPVEFLPIFIRNGLVEELDKFMIGEVQGIYNVLSQRLGKPYDLSLHINVSNNTLLDPDSDRLVRMIENINMPINQLVFELNEKVTDMKRLNRNLKKLKNIGCYFTMNDYSRDNQLFELLNHNYISHMRIDRQVVSIINEIGNYDIVQSMVKYANDKDKICIAEGIETVEQFNILRSCGVSVFQGFLLYKPIPIYEIDQIIKTIFIKVDWRKF